ncbi:MAG: helix-turn-helix domain-containing protein [Planctomycetota bacterium]
MADLLRKEEFEARTLLTIKEVREVFGIARSTVYRWLDRCWLRKAGQVQAPEEGGNQKISLLEILDADLQTQFDDWVRNERAEGRPVRFIVQDLVDEEPVELELEPGSEDPERLLAELDVLLERLSRQTIERERLLTELRRAEGEDGEVAPLARTRSRLDHVLEPRKGNADSEEQLLVERVDLPHADPVRDNPAFLYELGEERGSGLEDLPGPWSAARTDEEGGAGAEAGEAEAPRRRPWDLIDLDSIPAPLGDPVSMADRRDASADDDHEGAVSFEAEDGGDDLEVEFDGEDWVELTAEEENPMLREELVALDESFLPGARRRGHRFDIDKGMLSETELDALGDLATEVVGELGEALGAGDDEEPTAPTAAAPTGDSDIVDPTGGALDQGELAILTGDAVLDDVEFDWDLDVEGGSRVELQLDGDEQEPLHPVLQKALDHVAKGPSEELLHIAPELDVEHEVAPAPPAAAGTAGAHRDEVELEEDEDVAGIAGEEEDAASDDEATSLHLDDLEDGVLLSFAELDGDDEEAEEVDEEAYAQAFDDAMARAEDHVDLEADDFPDTSADEAWLDDGGGAVVQDEPRAAAADEEERLPHLSTDGSWLDGFGDPAGTGPDLDFDADAGGDVVFPQPEQEFDADDAADPFDPGPELDVGAEDGLEEWITDGAGEDARSPDEAPEEAALPAAAMADVDPLEPSSEMVKDGMMGIRLSILEVKEGLGILQEPVEKFSQNSESMRAGIEEMVAHARETRRALEGIGSRMVPGAVGAGAPAGSGFGLVPAVGLALLVLTWCLGLWLRTEGSRTSLMLVLGANLLITTAVMLIRRAEAPARG